MAYQEKVRQFCKKYHLDSGIEYRTLDLVSEVGEFAKEILKATDYGKEKVDLNDELLLEIGDMFYSLITIANSLGIDLEKALDEVMEKYKKRLERV